MNTQLLESIRSLIDGAVLTHIYDTSNGDVIEPDCEYHATLRDIDMELLTAGEPLPDVIELTLPGFDASSDATDDLVLWVWAGGATHDELAELCRAHGATLAPDNVEGVIAEENVDYWLPMDRHALTTRLRAAEQPQCRFFDVSVQYASATSLHSPFDTRVHAVNAEQAEALARKEFHEQAWSGQKTIIEITVKEKP